MALLVCVWLYLCIISVDCVFGITKNGGVSLIVGNGDSGGEQYVQIRSNINKKTHRNFLPANHKMTALSPAQQTHILDDVQKIYRIHSINPTNLDDPLKSSLFNSHTEVPRWSPSDQQSHLKYANHVSSDLLSPPQQTHDIPLPAFKPIDNSDTKRFYPQSNDAYLLSNPISVPESSSASTNDISTLDQPDTSLNDEIIKEIIIKTNPEELIAQDRQKFFRQLLREDKSSEDDISQSTQNDQTVAHNDLSNIRGQLLEKELLRQASGVVNSSYAISQLSLLDGPKVQIIKNRPSSTTSAPISTNLLEELTKGVVPPGTEYQVIKRNKDGRLEEVSNFPANLPQKQVAFVILEEQSNGSVKVQSVKVQGGKGNEKGASGEDVDTIIRKIKEGELKLPQSTRLSSKQTATKIKNNRLNAAAAAAAADDDSISKRKEPSLSHTAAPATSLEQKQLRDNKYFIPTPQPILQPTSPVTPTSTLGTSPYEYFSGNHQLFSSPIPTSTEYITATNFNLLNHADTEQPWTYVHQVIGDGSSSITQNPLTDPNLGIFHLNNSGYISNLFSALMLPASNLLLNSANQDGLPILQFPLLPTTSGNTAVKPVQVSALPTTLYRPKGNNVTSIHKPKRDGNLVRKVAKNPTKEFGKDNNEEESIIEELNKTVDAGNITLSNILKKGGFFAMARFFRQSELDNMLNSTGPFTLFIPTDKAFRSLLIQLGGPDKAEEKFKENPRLLNGLLLHHIIPGSFPFNTLQDEMTGVSLAGTQLRVNTYTTHDIEWNDNWVVTVNGAKILNEKDNIVIPQGIAHAIDRVMFPLPVGNLLQSLQADRESRYSNFLRILNKSNLSYLLTGGKTFTLFAPLNRAFTQVELTKILSDPSELKSFVLRHLIPGALYSAGMKYYQVRNSMEDGRQLTLYKEAGEIKVNNAHVITRNIPATNGVIHAIDTFLLFNTP